MCNITGLTLHCWNQASRVDFMIYSHDKIDFKTMPTNITNITKDNPDPEL